MDQTSRDRNGVLTQPDGYVAIWRCDKYHSGNTRAVLHTGTYYECQGCGTFIGAESLLASQQEARS